VSTRDRRFDDAAFLAALDQLIARLRSRHAGLEVRRILPEEKPSGDDWIWYFTHPASNVTVQVDPNWQALFLLSAEPAAGLVELDTVDHAVDLIERWLGLSGAGLPS
jgi:uncharacterized iron-regulated membrane protein